MNSKLLIEFKNLFHGLKSVEPNDIKNIIKLRSQFISDIETTIKTNSVIGLASLRSEFNQFVKDEKYFETKVYKYIETDNWNNDEAKELFNCFEDVFHELVVLAAYYAPETFYNKNLQILNKYKKFNNYASVLYEKLTTPVIKNIMQVALICFYADLPVIDANKNKIQELFPRTNKSKTSWQQLTDDFKKAKKTEYRTAHKIKTNKKRIDDYELILKYLDHTHNAIGLKKCQSDYESLKISIEKHTY